MTLERDGHVSFEEVEAVITYIDLKLTQKVSRLDLAKRLRSEAQLQFCIKSAMKEKKKQEESDGRHKKQVFHQLAGLEARILAENQKSP